MEITVHILLALLCAMQPASKAKPDSAANSIDVSSNTTGSMLRFPGDKHLLAGLFFTCQLSHVPQEQQEENEEDENDDEQTDGEGGEVQWSVEPSLEYSEVDCDDDYTLGTRFCIRLGALSPEDSSEDPFTVNCSYGSLVDSLSFSIGADPSFEENTDIELTLTVGEKGIIDFQAHQGVPHKHLLYSKDKKNINVSEFERDGGKLVFPEVKRSTAGVYKAKFVHSDTSRTITVTVVERHTKTAAVDEQLNITSDIPCLHWEKDDVILNTSSGYDVSNGGKTLTFAAVSSDDIGRNFVCVAEGHLRLETTLLGREDLTVCVREEQNRQMILRALKTTFTDQFCNGDKGCFSIPRGDLNINCHTPAECEVNVTIISTKLVVSRLESLLHDQSGPYLTHGLEILLGRCKSSITLVDPSSETKTEEDGIICLVKVVASVMAIVVVCLVGITCYFCCHRRQRQRQRQRVANQQNEVENGMPLGEVAPQPYDPDQNPPRAPPGAAGPCNHHRSRQHRHSIAGLPPHLPEHMVTSLTELSHSHPPPYTPQTHTFISPPPVLGGVPNPPIPTASLQRPVAQQPTRAGEDDRSEHNHTDGHRSLPTN